VPVLTTATGGREDPGTTRETPPDTRDELSSDCLSCDVTYDCNGPNNPGSIHLSTVDGSCLQPIIDLVCSGTLFGTTACSGGGGGAFKCGDVTCVPAQQSQPGVGGGAGSVGDGG
jgi:hypothetical protein